MKRLTLTLAAFVLMLYGCNSFNHYYPVDPTAGKQSVVVSGLKETVPASDIDPKILKEPPPTPEVFQVVPKGWCPPYTLPALPAVPKAPLDELNKVAPTDVGAIESMDIKHIVELHNYIITTRQMLDKSYSDYVKQCRYARRVKKTG